MNKPPLWEVMLKAYCCSTAADGSTDNWTIGGCYAAEISALRDWLVPEEEELPSYLRGSENHVRQIERQRLRALLTAAADRAERDAISLRIAADASARLQAVSGHGLLVGDTIKVEGLTNNSGIFNGTFKITAKDEGEAMPDD